MSKEVKNVDERIEAGIQAKLAEILKSCYEALTKAKPRD